MTIIRIAKVYDSILDETKTKGVFTRNGKEFMGPLFWKKEDWVGEEVKEVLEEVTVLDGESEEAEVACVIDEYIELAEKNGIKVTEDTKTTMAHWQYMNGFSDTIFLSAYH